jgi:glycosyltransferase involved in cell wall biosynthesis
MKSKKWLKKNFVTGELNILFWGRLVKEKGVLDIPEIAKRMPENMFFMAGTGILEEELKSRATDNLKVLGFVEENDLKRLLLSCDICLFPSHTEPFGIMILEAMAYGKPIIASRAGGIPDILENVGILVNPMNIDGFVNSIEALKHNDTRQRFSQASMKRIKEFSWEKTATRTMDFLSHKT